MDLGASLHYVLISLLALLLGHVVLGFLKKLRKKPLPELPYAHLVLHNGQKRPKSYLACNGLVFDVTESEAYKPEGDYYKLVGKDASVALARMSMSEEDLDLRLEDVRLSAKEQKTLKEWEVYFRKKYKVVARLV